MHVHVCANPHLFRSSVSLCPLQALKITVNVINDVLVTIPMTCTASTPRAHAAHVFVLLSFVW